ncbi:tetratricopeptide repeat protein [uncultured Cardiobacterium sp.]|uniref:tetratricopeptide repeat protein n=1 Tax=uncultured Cardiobacterium sp. TaxID=417619 RepID=UPI002637B76F|nr:tetratricopeptide repeat protein [uncultured Cardiobacterium sp.]
MTRNTLFPLLLALLFHGALASGDIDDINTCDRAADPIHPGNPTGVAGVSNITFRTGSGDDGDAPADKNTLVIADEAMWDALRLACENSAETHVDTPRYAYQLARLYEARGHHVSAEKYLRRAATAGDPVAQTRYGMEKINHWHNKAGLKWLGRAAAQGYIPAMEALGDYHENSVDIARSALWYQQAAAAGSGYAARRLGEIRLAENRRDEARNWLEQAAAHGDIRAMLLLGDAYRDSAPDKALTYYRAAAEAGEKDAYYPYARALHQNGKLTEALPWYRKAARDEQDGRAAETLGELYLSGTEVPQNTAEALLWLQRAHTPRAENRLAALFEHGDGVNRDTELALEHYGNALLAADDSAGQQETRHAHRKIADLTPGNNRAAAEVRKQHYRAALMLGDDSAIEALTALGEDTDAINALLQERRDTPETH